MDVIQLDGTFPFTICMVFMDSLAQDWLYGAKRCLFQSYVSTGT